jgi:hypothetical protein
LNAASWKPHWNNVFRRSCMHRELQHTHVHALLDRRSIHNIGRYSAQLGIVQSTHWRETSMMMNL